MTALFALKALEASLLWSVGASRLAFGDRAAAAS
jgi:hypothetical protein